MDHIHLVISETFSDLFVWCLKSFDVRFVGLSKLSASGQLFVGVHMAVSLSWTTHVNSNYMRHFFYNIHIAYIRGFFFYNTHIAYTNTNETKLVWIQMELSFFFSFFLFFLSLLPGAYMSCAYVRAWMLCCFHSLVSTQTFWRAPTASVDSCADIYKEKGFSGVTSFSSVWRKVPKSYTWTGVPLRRRGMWLSVTLRLSVFLSPRSCVPLVSGEGAQSKQVDPKLFAPFLSLLKSEDVDVRKSECFCFCFNVIVSLISQLHCYRSSCVALLCLRNLFLWWKTV